MVRKIIYVIFIIIGAFQFNINNSFPNGFIAKEANIMIGQPSSLYPGNSLLNFLLYGHADASFSLKDLATQFRTITTFIDQGYIIISKDYNLSGVFLDRESFLFPIPNGQLQKIPKASLDKYFPKGYIIRDTQFIDPYVPMISIQTYQINGKVKCSNCKGTLLFDQFDKLYDENEFMSTLIDNEMDAEYWIFWGYLLNYDPSAKKGQYKMIAYMHVYADYILTDILFADEKDAFLNFHQDGNYTYFDMKTTVIYYSSTSILFLQSSWDGKYTIRNFY